MEEMGFSEKPQSGLFLGQNLLLLQATLLAEGESLREARQVSEGVGTLARCQGDTGAPFKASGLHRLLVVL